jgi:hypothetical protein
MGLSRISKSFVVFFTRFCCTSKKVINNFTILIFSNLD